MGEYLRHFNDQHHSSCPRQKHHGRAPEVGIFEVAVVQHQGVLGCKLVLPAEEEVNFNSSWVGGPGCGLHKSDY